MQKFMSRKFLMATAVAIFTVANQALGLGLPSDAVLTVAGIAVTYILSQGAVDCVNGVKVPK